jgi:hypothetical protein
MMLLTRGSPRCWPLTAGRRARAGHGAGQRPRHAVPLGDLLQHRRAGAGPAAPSCRTTTFPLHTRVTNTFGLLVSLFLKHFRHSYPRFTKRLGASVSAF